MKEKTQAAAHAQQLKEQRKLEREQRKLEREQRARVRKEEKERKKQERQEREKEKERRAKQPKRIQRQRRATKRAASPVDTSELVSLFADLDVEDNGQCANCGKVFSQEDEDRFWVCYDRCDQWYCFACHQLPTKNSIPDQFYCMKCV